MGPGPEIVAISDISNKKKEKKQPKSASSSWLKGIRCFIVVCIAILVFMKMSDIQETYQQQMELYLEANKLDEYVDAIVRKGEESVSSILQMGNNNGDDDDDDNDVVESSATSTLTGVETTPPLSSKPTVAIVMGARSPNHPVNNLRLTDMSLSNIMLPSLIRTMETDRYNYQVYVGIDDDDWFWKDPKIQAELEQLCQKYLVQYLGRSSSHSSVRVPIFIRDFPKTPNHIPFNEILEVAYNYRDNNGKWVDYFVRINDDSEFLSEGWTTKAIDTLRQFTPPNVGVVGPTHQGGKVTILTHDMVHRSHFEIFGTNEYYPHTFDNWYLDDWMTCVYDQRRTQKISDWTMKHHISSHGTRYNPDTSKLHQLSKELSLGRTKILQYLWRLGHGGQQYNNTTRGDDTNSHNRGGMIRSDGLQFDLCAKPTIFACFPGSGMSLLRMIVEQFTSIYTGSIYNDDILRDNKFYNYHAEDTMKYVIGIKTHGPWLGHDTLMTQRLGIFGRGMERSILLLRNPEHTIISYFQWDHYNRMIKNDQDKEYKRIPSFLFHHTARKKNAIAQPKFPRMPNEQDWDNWANTNWSEQVSEWSKHLEFWVDNYAGKSDKQIFIITYESMLDSTSSSSRENFSSNSNLKNNEVPTALTDLVTFLDRPPLSREYHHDLYSHIMRESQHFGLPRSSRSSSSGGSQPHYYPQLTTAMKSELQQMLQGLINRYDGDNNGVHDEINQIGQILKSYLATIRT